MSWKGMGALIAIVLALAAPAHAQSLEEFYRNRTITILVGFTAGGGYDLYARLLGRHMGRHVPGNPAIMVQTCRAPAA
jgi:tripartite-type tricarboxylate transporter receptor subunit TctC